MNFLDETETISDDSVSEVIELLFVFILTNVLLFVIFDLLTDRAEN